MLLHLVSYFIAKERKKASRRINNATIAKATRKSSTMIQIKSNSQVLAKPVPSIVLKNLLNVIDFEPQKVVLYSFYLIKQGWTVLTLKQIYYMSPLIFR